MGFTRDDIAAYEKQPQTQIADNSAARAFGKAAAAPAPVPPAAAPAPAAEAPSAPAVDSVPAVPDDASSADTAVAATAPAEPDGGSETPIAPDPAAPDSRTIPYERFQAVIDERNALKKYGDLLFERLEATQKQSPAAAPAAAATPSAPETPSQLPTLASCGYDEAVFNQKMTEWHRAVARAEARSEIESQQAKQTSEQTQATYLEREAEFAKANPTFKEVTKTSLPAFARDTARTILESPEGPAIVFRLAKNPDEAVRLSRMSPAQQLVRLGELRAEVRTPAAPAASAPAKKPATPTTPRTVTHAPPPPKPTPGGSAPAPSGMPPNMADFVAQERAKAITDRQQRQAMRKAMR